MSAASESRAWPAEGVTRVPYWVYQDEDIYAREQERIYRGATWNFLGLEAELPDPGDRGPHRLSPRSHAILPVLESA